MRERVKLVNESELEIKMRLSPAAQAKLTRARQLIHTDTMAEVFERALDSLISEKEKALGKTKRAESDMASTPPAEQFALIPQKTYANARYIPAQFKRIIYARSNGQCEFTNSGNTRCSSRTYLEVDHVTPIALGDKTEIKNLRHLCRNHNQYRAR
jgi:5-methylcytosine-specific restriction endonuclease McrA